MHALVRLASGRQGEASRAIDLPLSGNITFELSGDRRQSTGTNAYESLIPDEFVTWRSMNMTFVIRIQGLTKSGFRTISNEKCADFFNLTNTTLGGSRVRKPVFPALILPLGMFQEMSGFRWGTI